MTDLISRREAYETLSEYYHHRTPIQHEALREALSRVPTIDPVKHGKWVRVTDGGDFEQMCCSECGRAVYSTYGFHLSGIKYCPYCGVRLDDEEQKKDIVVQRTDGYAVWDAAENWR